MFLMKEHKALAVATEVSFMRKWEKKQPKALCKNVYSRERPIDSLIPGKKRNNNIRVGKTATFQVTVYLFMY
jgi:hypothetical protein